jgi:hypothetical protein
MSQEIVEIQKDNFTNNKAWCTCAMIDFLRTVYLCMDDSHSLKHNNIMVTMLNVITAWVCLKCAPGSIDLSRIPFSDRETMVPSQGWT